jgi:hypothetical protein
MSTTVSVNALRTQRSRRIQILAAASAVVAAASITVTLAVAGGGSEASSQAPSAAPATAQPDRATLYRSEAAGSQPAGRIDGRRAAWLFHHR